MPYFFGHDHFCAKAGCGRKMKVPSSPGWFVQPNRVTWCPEHVHMSKVYQSLSSGDKAIIDEGIKVGLRQLALEEQKKMESMPEEFRALFEERLKEVPRNQFEHNRSDISLPEIAQLDREGEVYSLLPPLSDGLRYELRKLSSGETAVVIKK